MVFEGVVSVACFIAVRNKNRGMSPKFSNQSNQNNIRVLRKLSLILIMVAFPATESFFHSNLN
jgi:hypothetical protein